MSINDGAHTDQELLEDEMVGGSILEKVKIEIELLSRHMEVLRAVIDHQPIGIMKLSEHLGQPFHRIRYSLRVLEQTGYIRASPSGAVATRLTDDMLEHLDRDLDELIALLESMKQNNTREL